MIRVGLVGCGKAGQAVAQVLREDARYALRWIADRGEKPSRTLAGVPVVGLDTALGDEWLGAHPVDALVDFSGPETAASYADAVRRHGWMLVSAVSAYSPAQLEGLRALGETNRVLCSPNITVGINFLMLAARLLRDIAPFADVEIVEQHFREKPEVSGTAPKLAQTLNLGDEAITSLRLGGIVGHHEVIFGFPHQTVRLTHESIRREAFGTGAAFALQELSLCEPGFHTFDELLLRRLRMHLTRSA